MRHIVTAALVLVVCATGFAGEATPAPVTPPAVARDDKPVLGVQIDERAAGLDAGTGKGLPILHVVPASTAATLGLKVGDRLTTINGTPLSAIADLQALMATAKVGDALTIEALRGEERKTFTGAMQPAPSIRSIADEVRGMREDLERTRRDAGIGAKKEPTLAEVLQMLAEIERQLPKAVAEFKKQYPDGDFEIDVRIRIVSDKNAKDPIDLVPPPSKPTAGAGAGVEVDPKGANPAGTTPKAPTKPEPPAKP